MHPDRLSIHLKTDRYGDFTLTGAIRPGPCVPLRPREGYRIEVFRDREAKLRMPMLSAAVTAEKLFETFLELIEPLGEVVHVVLESSHGSERDHHIDLRRDHIDRSVLASHLCDFEELLTDDGCTGVAVMAPDEPVEVQFDEHKLLHIYSPDLKPFCRVLRRMGVNRRRVLPLISEAEHFHHTTEELGDQFRQLAMRMGVGDFDRVLADENW
ncbi:MAG TPA: hypothetical protein VLM40_09810 [Gemmata sp.]|nr:hypothetical protein [Gemmata sp.]